MANVIVGVGAILLIIIGMIVSDCAKWMRNARSAAKVAVILAGSGGMALGIVILLALAGAWE